MKTIEINLYKFSELSKEAQQKAIDKWYESEEYPFLSSDIEEYSKILFEENKIEASNITILYSLSWSQGDGLYFTGKIEKDNTTLKLTHNGRYYYANSVTMEFFGIEGEEIEDTDEKAQELKTIYFDICSKLEKHGYEILEYRMNTEEFNDLCEANDYYFLENGTMRNS